MRFPQALLALSAAAALPSVAAADLVSSTAFETGNIEAGGDGGSNDYYGSGNDDNFGEYGIASFLFDVADFGGDFDLSSIAYTLTHNDRGFTDGDAVRFYFTPDDFDTVFTGLTYDGSGASDPDGVNAGQFGQLFDLGAYAYAAQDGGTTSTFDLRFDDAARASLLAELQAGSQFNLLIAADTLDADVTFSGTGNTFDPGDPLLEIGSPAAVPEPGTVALIGFAACGLAGVRRRRAAA